MIHEKIKQEITEAMKARESERLSYARNLSAALTNEAIAKGKKPDTLLSDDEALVVVQRMAKQRKESIAQFKEGGRDDLVGHEEAELTYLETFLPQMMGKDEILPVAEAKKAELGVEDKTQMGKLIGAVMAELKGKADGTDVKEVVESLF
ncbi:MAG: GatB/YqeY domain-containing protein [Candidatus Paceibacterota bacterium]